MTSLSSVVLEFTTVKNLSQLETEILNQFLDGKFSLNEIATVCKCNLDQVHRAYLLLLKKTECESRSEILSKILLRLREAQGEGQEEGEKPLVFVVDDEPEILELLKESLARESIACQTFLSAESCMQELQKTQAHVVVSDVRLKDMDGLSFLKKVQTHLPLSPDFIFVSSNCSEEMATQLRESGAVAHLEKPVSLEFLNETILQCFYSRVHDRRRAIRIDVKLPVKISLKSRVKLLSENLGIGGIFLSVDESLAGQVSDELTLGTSVRLGIELDELVFPVLVEGKVAWVRKNQSMIDGIGVQFVRFLDTSQKDLLDFVKSRRLLLGLKDVVESKSSSTIVDHR